MQPLEQTWLEILQHVLTMFDIPSRTEALGWFPLKNGEDVNFEFEGSGRIWLRELSTGEMAIYHSGFGTVIDVFMAVCCPARSYWSHSSRTFVICKKHIAVVIKELGYLHCRQPRGK